LEQYSDYIFSRYFLYELVVKMALYPQQIANLLVSGDSARPPRTAPALCDEVELPSLESSLQRGGRSGGGRGITCRSFQGTL